jgi:predicted nuclease with TOPRIM domain
MNKWIPRFQMMGYVKVDFVDAYEVKEIPGKVGEVIPLPAEKYNELKKALTDKLAGVEPPKPKSAMEIENMKLKEEMEELRKQNREIINRLDSIPGHVEETKAKFETLPPADDTGKVSKPTVKKPRVKK